jgi:hypothetical protein
MEDAPKAAVDISCTLPNEALTNDLRVQRLVEYTADSLAKENALEANLGVINGDLMLLEYRFRQGLDELFKESPHSLEELTIAMPSVDAFLRIAKQIDRYSQFAAKLASVGSRE